MDGEAVERFHSLADHLITAGAAPPGVRLMGFVFKSREEERQRLEKFQQRMFTIGQSNLKRVPKADWPSIASSLPFALMIKHGEVPQVLVVVNNEEARGIALSKIGRPTYQTVVPTPGA